MKRTLILMLIATSAFAQSPQLSTADQIAIRDCEQKKSEAQKQYQDAQNAEMAVEREFSAAHPGFHVNPSTFAVESDPKVAQPAVKK